MKSKRTSRAPRPDALPGPVELREPGGVEGESLIERLARGEEPKVEVVSPALPVPVPVLNDIPPPEPFQNIREIPHGHGPPPRFVKRAALREMFARGIGGPLPPPFPPPPPPHEMRRLGPRPNFPHPPGGEPLRPEQRGNFPPLPPGPDSPNVQLIRKIFVRRIGKLP